MITIATRQQNIDEAHLVMARCYAEKKNIAKAIEYYNLCIKPDKDIDPPGERPDMMYNESDGPIMELAELYEESYDFDNALKTYDLLDNDRILDGKENMHRMKGWVYYKQQQFDAAIEHYRQALGVNPKDEDGSINETLGELYWQKKMYKEAMECFKKALEHNPKSAESYYGLGLCYQDTNDYYLAMHNYTEALKIKPDYAEAINNIASLTFIHEGDVKKAIELVEKAVANATEDSPMSTFYLNLKRLYDQIADYEKSNYYKIKFIESTGFDMEIQESDEDEDDGQHV